MSLKTFHLVFILLAIMGADLFGGWAIHEYRVHGDKSTLILGLLCILGGLGLTVYVVFLVRALERTRAD